MCLPEPKVPETTKGRQHPGVQLQSRVQSTPPTHVLGTSLSPRHCFFLVAQ